MSLASKPQENNLHLLSDKWVLWAHLPHDTNWSIDSYNKISTIDSIEECIELMQSIKETIVKNCMLFIMRDGINPMWEDERNVNGGCFSFKINNKQVYSTWKNICFMLLGNTLSNSDDFMTSINGVTISPKKTFCIIKIWTSSCDCMDPGKINTIDGVTLQSAIFKKHNTNK